MTVLGRKDITSYTEDELSLLVSNEEDLYNLAEDTNLWTDEKAIALLTDVIDNRYIYTVEQWTNMIKHIKEYYSSELDLGDINDPMVCSSNDYIDTPFGPVHKNYPMEPDFNTIEDKLEYLYGEKYDYD